MWNHLVQFPHEHICMYESPQPPAFQAWVEPYVTEGLQLFYVEAKDLHRGLWALASKTPVAPCGIVPDCVFFQSWHRSWQNITPLTCEYSILFLGGLTEPEGKEQTGEGVCLQQGLFSIREDEPQKGAAGRLEQTVQGLGSGNQRVSHPPGYSNHKFVVRKLLFWQYGPKVPLSVANQKLRVCRTHPCLQDHMPQSKRDGQSHWPKHTRGNTMAIKWYRWLKCLTECRPPTNRHDSALKFYLHLLTDMKFSNRATYHEDIFSNLRICFPTLALICL